METLTIGEVARRSGVTATTLRYYEQINVLPPAERINGQRRYNPEILERLAFITVAQRLGFSLSEIGLLCNEQQSNTPLSERWQAMAHQKLSELDQLIKQAQSIRLSLISGLRCTCSNLDDCIDCVVEQCGEQPLQRLKQWPV